MQEKKREYSKNNYEVLIPIEIREEITYFPHLISISETEIPPGEKEGRKIKEGRLEKVSKKKRKKREKKKKKKESKGIGLTPFLLGVTLIGIGGGIYYIVRKINQKQRRRHGMSWSDAAKETLRECGEKIGLKRYMDQLRSETQATEGTERIGERFQTEGAMQQPGIEREEERREPITQ